MQAAVDLVDAGTRSARLVHRLLALLRSAPEARRREAAAWALAFLGPDGERRRTEMVNAFRDALADPGEDPTVRGQAAEGLAETMQFTPRSGRARMPFLRAVFALIGCLEDPSAEVRFWSAFALGRIRAKAALPALRRFAETEEATLAGWWSVREEAADALASVLGDTVLLREHRTPGV